MGLTSPPMPRGPALRGFTIRPTARSPRIPPSKPMRRACFTTPTKQPARRRGAFTLVELIMVVITAALLAGLAIPRWAGAIQHYRLDLAAQRVTNDLALAQARANFGSAAITVAFTP